MSYVLCLTVDQSSPFQYENNDPTCGSFEEDHHYSPAADEEVNLPLPADIPSPAVEQSAPAGGSEEVSTTSTGSRRSGMASRKPAWMKDYAEKWLRGQEWEGWEGKKRSSYIDIYVFNKDDKLIIIIIIARNNRNVVLQ